MSLLKSILIGSLTLAVVGCKVGPDYKAPELKNLPTEFSNSATTQPTTQPTPDSAVLERWWETFNDPELASLLQRAALQNLDLKVAQANLRAARAERGVADADLYPNVNVDGSYTHQRSSIRNGGGNLPANNRSTDSHRAAFDASWELDLFGGNQRAIEAADASLESAREASRDVMVSLMAEVAGAYINFRGLQSELALTTDNLKSQSQSLELTRSRFKAGLTSELDVANAQAQVATTAASIPSLEQAMKQTVHRLGILLGQPPASLIAELSEVKKIPTAPTDLPAGLPSELLKRRPDVRRSERNLAAATAQIGVATSNYFPKFSLTGSFGWQSQKLSDLPSRNSNFFSYGPSMSWPIFDANRIRNQVRIQTAQQEAALATFEKVVLASLADVENSLVALNQEQVRRAALQQSVDANLRATDLATQLYSKGLGDFLNVLQAQRALLAAEVQLAQSQTQVSTNLVALYKALGGGWEIPPAKPSNVQPKSPG